MRRLSIARRLGLLVLALAVPLNLIALASIWGLIDRATDEQRQSLLYAARSIAAGVDATLDKYLALGEALARSPALLDDNLDAFNVEARRQFPAEGGAWVLVADVSGQQLLNTLIQWGKPLPRRNRQGIETQQRAFAKGSAVISDVFRGKIAQDWVINIEIPIWRNGQPFRALAVGIRHQEFRDVLSVRDIPQNWLAGLIDGQGRFIDRFPQGDAEVGQLASEGWRATKDQADGLFEFKSLEGEPLINANAHPSISNWTVGVAIKKAELRAATWDAARWAVFLGAGLSAASLVLAGVLARQITGPITQLQRSFADISTEPAKPIAAGPPEIMALQDTLYRAAAEQQKASQALLGALTKLEHEMDLREEAQAALAKSQRMQAVGQLAGGMAHDFNNVLAAISSHLDTVTLRSSDEKVRKAVQGAMDAIEMGASLNRRLLSFSRRSGVGWETIDLNDRVRGAIELLQRTLGDQVTVTWNCSPDPCRVSASPGDVDNALLNLAINARDAMPSGGVLTIETRQVSLDADAAARIANARPGDFVRLTVRDTGEGMTPNVLERAMEPFFTTKEQGTGLGLATVYGLAQRSNGFVAIESAAGKGTTVHLYFPKVANGQTASPRDPPSEPAPLGHGERILVVEDNDKVRDAVAGRLESLGYTVLQARSGCEAVELLRSGESVALVFSDIVLPGGVTGYDVAAWVRSSKPHTKVVVTSGYSDIPAMAGDAVGEVKMLDKPYTRQQLAHVLREALDS